MQRRRFFRQVLGGCLGCTLWGARNPRSAVAQDAIDFALSGGDSGISRTAALHYDRLADDKVICRLCPRECQVADRERGYCGVRENVGGEYFTLVHGRVCAVHVDPIEKKPFYHFLPGTDALSIATPGCNMECRFCQNWQISQFRPEQVGSNEATPAGLLNAAQRHHAASIAYTYGEPTVFYEYMLDIARYTAPRGMRNVVVSNGFIGSEALRELAPHLAAYKVDLKAFTERFYREQCSARLSPVLDTLRLLRSLDLWTEIVVLIIPTLNDDEASNREMFRWIHGELGPDVPVHLSRFHPTYKIQNLPRTPMTTLERLHELARLEGLHYVYIGNAQGHPAESTYCPECGEKVIERFGYVIGEIRLDHGQCRQCQYPIAGVWEPA